MPGSMVAVVGLSLTGRLMLYSREARSRKLCSSRNRLNRSHEGFSRAAEAGGE